MTIFNRQYFIDNILNHDDFELTLSMYQDWLIEQGDPKLEEVSDFRRAFNGCELAYVRLVARFGDIDLLPSILTEQQCRQATVNFVWLIPQVKEEPDFLEILKRVWLLSLGSYQIQTLQNDGLNNWVRHVDQYSGSQEEFVLKAVDNLTDANYGWSLQFTRHRVVNYFEESFEALEVLEFVKKLHLIASSYVIFGVNILPDSYEREGLAR